MRPLFPLGRSLCSRTYTRILPPPYRLIHTSRPRLHNLIDRRWTFRRPPRASGIKLAAATLTPAAFIQIFDDDPENGETAEERMLEASREELNDVLPDDLHGWRRVRRRIYLFFQAYFVEPVATVFRFLHLVVIFVPVIGTVPAIWVGRRVKERDNERTGTLWWYQFLVSSMERAGPAFIKVLYSPDR